AQAERIAGTNKCGQLIRKSKTVRHGLETGRAARGITAKRQHVVHLRRRQPVENALELVARRTDACQMCHGLERLIALDLADKFDCTIARAAAGAVRDRDIGRMQVAQGLDGASQGRKALVRLRREELEGKARAPGTKQLADSHIDYIDRASARLKAGQPRQAGFSATAFSRASISFLLLSGSSAGPKRPTTLPLRSTRNLLKFHGISPANLGLVSFEVRNL